MKRSTRITLVIIAIALLPVIVKLQATIDPQRAQFQPGKGVSSVMTQMGNNPIVLPSQFVAGTVIGFREVVAGLLWVRVNDFFHSGNYEAIVPLNRMITWMDPHLIDVYCTGAWHLAYNFVDAYQRADHRYLAPAIKFLEEGVQNNPGVWDPEFDLGFMLYSLKAQNYEKALEWMLKSSQEKDVSLHVYRQVAHAYERAGRIDDAIRQWQFCIAQAEQTLKKTPKDHFARTHLGVSRKNLDGLLVRKIMRADLSKRQRDIGFEAYFKRLGPRKFKLSGTANLPDYTRIEVTLYDADYKEPNIKTFNWEIDPNSTEFVELGMHGMVIENGKFEREYDLSRDPKQYPFKKKKYILTFTFNPRSTWSDAQDLVGWSGEGLTDKKYLDTSEPGIRKVTKVFYLNREGFI